MKGITFVKLCGPDLSFFFMVKTSPFCIELKIPNSIRVTYMTDILIFRINITRDLKYNL